MSGPMLIDLAVLAGLWTAYFAVHSVLAATAVRQRILRRWPFMTPAYRLFYNYFAVLLLAFPLGWWLLIEGEKIWRWSGAGAWLADGLALAACGLFVLSLRWYDGARFLGLAQWRGRCKENGTSEGDGPMVISPLHRFVRHPWYFFALVIVWTRDMSAAQLVSSACITLYFIVGTRLEEDKLLACYGEAYREYQKRVACLAPLPWRVLSAGEAGELQELSRSLPAARSAPSASG